MSDADEDRARALVSNVLHNARKLELGTEVILPVYSWQENMRQACEDLKLDLNRLMRVVDELMMDK